MGNKKSFDKLIAYLEDNNITHTIIGPIGHRWNFGRYVPKICLIDMASIPEEELECLKYGK
jgi:hypothetical protein